MIRALPPPPAPRRGGGAIVAVLAAGAQPFAAACADLLGIGEFTDAPDPDAGLGADAGADAGDDADAEVRPPECSSWARPVVDLASAGTMLLGERIVTAVNRKDGTVALSSFDPCTGQPLAVGSFLLAGYPTVGLGSAALLERDVVAFAGAASTSGHGAGGGATDSAGVVAYVADSADGGLGLLDAAIYQQTVAPDEIWSVASDPAGLPWIAGHQGWRRWIARVQPDGSACPVGGDEVNQQGRVMVDLGLAGVAAILDQTAADGGPRPDGMRVEHYPSEACDGGCDCTPSSTTSLGACAAWNLTAGAVLLDRPPADPVVVVVGACSDDATTHSLQTLHGFIGAYDVKAPAAPFGFATWSNSVVGDGLIHVAAGAEAIYVVGLSGWVSPGSERGYSLLRYPFDIVDHPNEVVPETIDSWPNGALREVEALAVTATEPDGLVLLVITADDRALLVRCNAPDDCPDLFSVP